MIKKLAVLLVPFAAVAALAVSMAPLSASADTFFKCPKGVHQHKYCKKIKKCVEPNVRKMTVAQARAAMRAHNCKVRRVVYNHGPAGNRVPAGHVYRQSPPAHTVHPRGFGVTLFVTAIPRVQDCVVPNLKKDTVAQARAMLRAYGCSLGNVTYAREPAGEQVAEGRIYKQSPSSRTIKPKGFPVNVWVERR